MSESFLSADNLILILFYAVTVGVTFGALRKELQNQKEMILDMKNFNHTQNNLLRQEIRDMKIEFSGKFDKSNKYGVRIGILENDLHTAWSQIDELKECYRDFNKNK